MKRVIYSLGSLAMLVMVGCHGEATSSPAPSVPEVEVVEVVQHDVPVYQEWIGTTEGLVSAQIRAQIAGYLLRRTYLEGDFVKRGDLLFEINPVPFKAAYLSARAKVQQAEARLLQTTQNYERVKPLLEEQAVSKKDVDDAAAEQLATKAALEAAKGDLVKAKFDLDNTSIVAPIDGIVGVARAQIGDLVGPNDELTYVSTVDPIRVYFPISEQEYLRIAGRLRNSYQTKFQDQEPCLELILADGSQYPHKGKYFLVDRQIDITTGTIRVAGLFPNPGNLLRPGQHAKVRTVTQTIQGAFLIPQRAVMELQGAYQVAVVKPDNTVELRPVKVRDRIGSLWIIEQGLAKGEHVVTAGLQKVKSGMTVNSKLTQVEPGEQKAEMS